MQMKRSKKLLSFILCMALTVAMAFMATGCNGNTDAGTSQGSGVQTDTRTQSEDNSQGTESSQSTEDVQQLGEGSMQFAFTVVDKEGAESKFEIHTDKETVGEALLELELISGDEGEYGLYVKTVNGITADYDKDGVYWAFYVNDEYAQAGVDATPVTEGASYAFKVE